eukprot:3198229-Rhodomonas_salina.7
MARASRGRVVGGSFPVAAASSPPRSYKPKAEAVWRGGGVFFETEFKSRLQGDQRALSRSAIGSASLRVRGCESRRTRV